MRRGFDGLAAVVQAALGQSLRRPCVLLPRQARRSEHDFKLIKHAAQDALRGRLPYTQKSVGIIYSFPFRHSAFLINLLILIKNNSLEQILLNLNLAASGG
jgi:hypothetical protein